MDDGIIKGTGNSRYLKSAISPDAPWEEAREQLIAGTFSVDLNGINPEGWEQLGTPNDKANLLSDETGALLGGAETVNEAFYMLSAAITSTFPIVVVTAPAGSTVTISDGAISYSPFENNGTWRTYLPHVGTWTVIAELNSRKSSTDITMDAVKTYTVNFPDYAADKTLNNNDWETISIISQAGTGALYWDVGDAKEIELNGKVGDFLTLDHKKLCVFILGFNHKDNGVARNGILWGGFKTAVVGGVDVALVDSKYNTPNTDGSKCFNMNHKSNSNMGGWKGCDSRYDILGACSQAPENYNGTKVANNAGYDATAATLTSPVENTLLAAFPEDMRKVMVLRTHWVDNVGNAVNTDACVTAVKDAISFLAEYEIFGVSGAANEHEQNHQAQVQYYADGNDKRRYNPDSTTIAVSYWECSPCSENNNSFCYSLTPDTYSGALLSLAAGSVWLT